MKIRDITLEIVQGDITTCLVEAIVNVANTNLILGSGVAGAILRQGGYSIQEEVLKKAPIDVGSAVATGAGQLSARYVIHAATMGPDLKTNESYVRQACANALNCAATLGVTSVALPALGCGVGEFSSVGTAKIMTQEVLKFARFTQSALRKVVFCLYDQETFDIFTLTSRGYVDHIQDTLGLGPYVTVDIIIKYQDGLILIERSNPPYGWALPGGFVDYGESLETAACREAKEETNLNLVDLHQFHTYSTPDRDPRFHTVSTVFVAKGQGEAQWGDDAKGLMVVPFQELLARDYVFDHKKVIQDYLKNNKYGK